MPGHFSVTNCNPIFWLCNMNFDLTFCHQIFLFFLFLKFFALLSELGLKFVNWTLQNEILWEAELGCDQNIMIKIYMFIREIVIKYAYSIYLYYTWLTNQSPKWKRIKRKLDAKLKLGGLVILEKMGLFNEKCKLPVMEECECVHLEKDDECVKLRTATEPPWILSSLILVINCN